MGIGDDYADEILNETDGEFEGSDTLDMLLDEENGDFADEFYDDYPEYSDYEDEVELSIDDWEF